MTEEERDKRMRELIILLHANLIPFNPPMRDYSWLQDNRPDLHAALEEYLKLKEEEECEILSK